MSKDFEGRTAGTLRSCAKWLDEHADELAHGFCGSMGCQGWSVHFDSNAGYVEDGMGYVAVHAVNQKLATIDYDRGEPR